MDSPLARVILALLGGYFIMLFFVTVYDWITEEYPRRPPKSISETRIQHPVHHDKAVNAIQMFLGLPKSEKVSIKKNLESNLISMEQWLTDVNLSSVQIMCVGEHHEESTRDFLAKEFFTRISTDVLLLEATPEKLKGLIKRMDAGRDYYPLLGADILNILRTVTDRNPDIKTWGIEETDEQQRLQRATSNSRDQSIAHNFWNRFQPEKRHIILFGALHCSNESNWLFKNLSSQASPPLKKRMLNVRVLGEHQNGPLEAFVYFLDEIGIEKKAFVIADTSSLHPRIYELFQLLYQEILAKYHSLIVFRGKTDVYTINSLVSHAERYMQERVNINE